MRYIVVLLMSSCLYCFAQQEKSKAVEWFEGAVLVGYVDQGAFLNFTGPSVVIKNTTHKLTIGMLPSLRFKKDESTVKNAFIFPTLGAGLTYSRKHIVIQVPCYYTSKTVNQNGRWSLGFGVGYRFK